MGFGELRPYGGAADGRSWPNGGAHDLPWDAGAPCCNGAGIAIPTFGFIVDDDHSDDNDQLRSLAKLVYNYNNYGSHNHS